MNDEPQRDLIIIGRIFYNSEVFKKISEKILSNEEKLEIKIIEHLVLLVMKK